MARLGSRRRRASWPDGTSASRPCSWPPSSPGSRRRPGSLCWLTGSSRRPYSIARQPTRACTSRRCSSRAPVVGGRHRGSTPSGVSNIEHAMSGTPLATSAVALKVWSPQGEIVYSPTTALIGLRFPVAGDLASAVQGTTAIGISDLHAMENVKERARWSSLVETYVPIHDRGTGRVIGVTELYEQPDKVANEIAAAENGSWLGHRRGQPRLLPPGRRAARPVPVGRRSCPGSDRPRRAIPRPCRRRRTRGEPPAGLPARMGRAGPAPRRCTSSSTRARSAGRSMQHCSTGRASISLRH